MGKLNLNLIAFFAIVLLAIPSCNDYEGSQDESQSKYEDLKGIDDFQSSVLNLNSTVLSRSEEEDPTTEEIADFIRLSKDFLSENGITKEDLGIEDEELLAVVAVGLVEFRNDQIQLSRGSDPMGCFFEALGVKAITEGLSKYAYRKAAEQIVKAAVKKAIPYVGWGMFAWDFIGCAFIR